MQGCRYYRQPFLLCFARFWANVSFDTENFCIQNKRQMCLHFSE